MLKDNKTYFIAEVGPNHQGSLKIAKEYVKVLSQTGVDAVKFQIGIPEEHYSLDAFFPKYQLKNYNKKFNLFRIVKDRLLKFNEHLELYNYCKEKKIDYLCSAFDTKSLNFLLNEFKLKFIKVPSCEILTLDYLDVLSKVKIPIILSTGMATENEIDYAINRINKNFKKKIYLLHCVSSYPTDKKNVNLNYMVGLKNRFKDCEVGFSDHTVDLLPSIVAASMGAKIIEKHVTFNNYLTGPDHQASLNIYKLNSLIKNIRGIEVIKGRNIKIISKNELQVKKSLRKSCVTKRKIKKGMKIKLKDIVFKRPGNGISPMNVHLILKKKAKVDIGKSKVILKSYLV